MTTLPPSDSIDFLARLIEARGPSGFEAEVQQCWLEQAVRWADAVDADAYGNAWAVLEPPGAQPVPTVIVTGHADEIGLMVNHIESSGLLRVVPVGGVDAAVMPGRRVRLRTATGDRIGVVGAVPIHLQEKKTERKTPTIDQLFIDCGFADEAEARSQVSIGDVATVADAFERIGERRAVSRATDNRIGIFAAAEVLRRAAARRDELQVRLIALSTVQEEIGTVGAQFVTRRLDPDLALVVDVTHATDVPGVSQAKHGKVTLGGGPTITHGTSNHPKLVRRLLEVAEREGITVQQEASSRYTGTDTDAIYRATRGIPSALVSLPNRYMHTPSEVIDLGDLEQLICLLTETVLGMDPETSFRNVEVPRPG